MIVEKELGIPPDYQFKALRSKNYFQRNWHSNKWFVIKKLLKLNKNCRILDLGTGSGNFEILFSRDVKEIVGVDYNDDAVNFLKDYLKKKKIRNVRLIVSDIRGFNEKKGLGKFDAIILVDVIEHIKISHARNVVRGFDKLLKKGGRVCIITPNYKSPWILIEWFFDKVKLVPKFEGKQHLAEFYKTNLSKMFQKIGYSVDYIGSFNTFSFLIPSKYLSEKLVNLELKTPFAFGNLLVGVFSKE